MAAIWVSVSAPMTSDDRPRMPLVDSAASCAADGVPPGPSASRSAEASLAWAANTVCPGTPASQPGGSRATTGSANGCPLSPAVKKV